MSVPYLLQHTKAGVPKPDVSSITLNLVKELYPQEWGQQLRSPNLFQGEEDGMQGNYEDAHSHKRWLRLGGKDSRLPKTMLLTKDDASYVKPEA